MLMHTGNNAGQKWDRFPKNKNGTDSHFCIEYCY